MRRVLFVDDEPRILQGIENLLFDLYEEWDITTAENGHDALLRLSEQEFDVLVTDMRMPGMDGADLLDQVRVRFPNVALFVLSGHADREALLSTLGTVHRFLAKPCDGPHLIETLQQTSGFLTRVATDMKENLGRATSLPSASSFTMEGCGKTVPELVKKVESDAAAALLVLRAADLFLKSDAATTDIRTAIDRLGVEFTHSVLCSMPPPSSYAGLDQDIVDGIHAHGRLVAECARAIAGDAKWKETAFITGLFHDIAHLLSYSIDPEAYDDSPITQTNLDGHAELGATILGLWGFRKEVVDVVAHHHDLEQACESYPSVMSSVVLAEAISFSLLKHIPCEAFEYLPPEVLMPLVEKVKVIIESLENEAA